MDVKAALETAPTIGTERMSERETAAYLGINSRTLQGFRFRREGPPYLKIGGRVLCDRIDVDACLASCRVVPDAADVSTVDQGRRRRLNSP